MSFKNSKPKQPTCVELPTSPFHEPPHSSVHEKRRLVYTTYYYISKNDQKNCKKGQKTENLEGGANHYMGRMKLPG